MSLAAFRRRHFSGHFGGILVLPLPEVLAHHGTVASTGQEMRGCGVPGGGRD
ncbi:MAG: hypothetical protein OEZ06_29355 [Myxococcales bacterium]|nr:hypothetical protein [Myxococcales bacterium]